jgi:xylan 1,4-beta-xylosidase
VIRVGEWYYLAVSSFEWFPTIPLYRSRDLATWRQIGSVVTAVSRGDLFGVPDSAGIWAPSLSYDGNLFWVTYSIVRTFHGRQLDVETYIATARDPAGQWSEPTRVSGHGFDPALFHRDGRHYLLNVQSDSRPGGSRFSGIILVPLNEAGTEVAGRPTMLLQHPTLIEGPKMLHYDGWYYLVLAQGGTGVEHGVLMARSRTLIGPYELDDRPLLTSRDDRSLRLQKAGHAELIEAPDGRWFLSHLASRWLDTAQGRQFPWGREVGIQEITWIDGWPRLAGGGWHPADTFQTPTESGEAGEAPDGAAEENVEWWPWRSLREPIGAWAERRSENGAIRLRGRHGVESYFGVSMVAKPLQERACIAETVVHARPNSFTHSAGLALWYNSTSYYLLELTWAEPPGQPQTGQQWREEGQLVVQVVARDRADARVIARRGVVPGVPVRLSASICGPVVQFRADGAELGPQLDLGILSDDYGDLLRFTGSMVGIYCVDTVDASFSADFDGLTIRSS